MAQVMGQRQRFGQIFIQTQGAGKRPGDLADLECMGEPGAEMVPFMGHENLSLMFQTPEGHRMGDAVAVALKSGPRGALGFLDEPAA